MCKNKVSGILQDFLKEVKTSNETLHNKVLELEKKVGELESSSSKTSRKSKPSCEVRVSILCCNDDLIIVIINPQTF